MSSFSNALKRTIEDCGVPVSEIAQKGGMSAAMLYKIQNGSRMPDSLDTLNRLLDAMFCALPVRRELIQAYQVERIGQTRYQCFQEMKRMMAELANIPALTANREVYHDLDFPDAIVGSDNVNAVVQNILEQETMRPGGMVQMMVPLGYGYCFECLSQVLRDCHPEFGGVCHLFCLKATATDEALLFNMRAIRAVLPRILTMRYYDPKYSYLPDPNDGTVLYPHCIITSGGVLLLSGDFQNAVFHRDPAVRDLCRSGFAEMSRRFTSIMRSGPSNLAGYFQIYWDIMSRLNNRNVMPIVMSSAPSILACIDQKTSMKYLPPQMLDSPEFAEISKTFYQISGAFGYVTFYTVEGLKRLLDTGMLAEMQGPEIPRLSQEDVVAALEEMLRRAKQGVVVPYLFRQDIFRAHFRFCMGLYDTKLLSVCEVPQRQAVFADLTEATLARVLRDYANNALLLGDAYSPEESIQLTEEILREFQKLSKAPQSI